MSEKQFYLRPEAKVIAFCPEEAIMTGSVLRSASATGEDVTYGDTFNPWN